MLKKVKPTTIPQKSASVIITIAAILLMFFVIYYITLPSKESVEAVKGYSDLSNWDFEKNGVTFLNGKWDFYPGKLLTPQEISSEIPQEIKVPGNWSKKQPYSINRGSATYHLSVDLPKNAGPLAIKVQNIWMAHRLYINGVLVKEMGRPSYNYTGHESKNTPYLVNLGPVGHIDIVIQVSNHTYYSGGIIHPIQLGAAGAMFSKAQLALGLDMTGFFIFLLFGIFHLQMYQMRDRETEYLYSGLFLLLMSLVTATTGEKLFMQVLDNLSFAVTYKFQDIVLMLSIIILALFIQVLEPRTIKAKLLRCSLIPLALYIIMAVFVPIYSYTYFKGYITLYASLILLVFILRFIYILLRRENTNLPLEEFIYISASFTFISIAFFDAIIYHLGYVTTNIAGQVSMLGFILFLNLLLARRFTNKTKEAQALSEELAKSNRIKDEFLKRTTYAIKTPLKGISNISAHLLKEKNQAFTAEQREDIVLIQDTSNKLSLFVNDLIDAIKLRHEDMQLQIKTVDLYVIIQVIFELLSFDIKEKDIHFINQIKPITLVYADENRLRQILYNVLSNAVKYTERGTIKANAVPLDDFIRLTIEDTGIGISQDKWELIFQDIYTEEAGEPLHDGKMGLGLYISRKLARKMNGDVWVSDSVLGKGTAIAIKLPKGEPRYHKQEAENTVVDHYEVREADAAKPEKQLKKLLLVDDEAVNIRILSLIFREEFETYGVYSGEEALNMLQKNSFNLVVTDLMMPGMSGIELIQKIRKNYSVLDLPIIIMKSGEDERGIELAYQTGANDFISKPFVAEEVKVRIRSLLQLADSMEAALQNELAFLQAQIKPHFIYNALSNIIAICYDDGERAAEVLTQLSKFLRYIFQRDQSNQRVTLLQELELIKAYVEIERLRFGGRLHFSSFIDEEVLEKELFIPVLLVQPLVENAIRHGLFNKTGEGIVTLTITEGAEAIRIVVEDDGIGMSDDQLFDIMNRETGRGVGIKNTQRRVMAIPKASFTIHSELEKGTRCTMFLPKEALLP